MIKRILCVVLMLFVFAMPAYAEIDEDIDRNLYESDQTYGTNSTVQGQKPQETSSPQITPIPQNPNQESDEMLSETEVEEKEQLQLRTSLVDTVIYYTGVFMWVFATCWVSFCVFDKVLPFATAPIISRITHGKRENYDLSIPTIVGRFFVITAIGTLFVTGYVKIWLGQFFGWVLSR